MKAPIHIVLPKSAYLRAHPSPTSKMTTAEPESEGKNQKRNFIFGKYTPLHGIELDLYRRKKLNKQAKRIVYSSLGRGRVISPDGLNWPNDPKSNVDFLDSENRKEELDSLKTNEKFEYLPKNSHYFFKTNHQVNLSKGLQTSMGSPHNASPDNMEFITMGVARRPNSSVNPARKPLRNPQNVDVMGVDKTSKMKVPEKPETKITQALPSPFVREVFQLTA